MSRHATIVAAVLVAMLWAVGNGLACGSGQVLFKDDFAILDPSWGASTGPNLSLAGGALTLQANPGYAYNIQSQSGLYTDYEVCVQAVLTATQGPEGSVIGGAVFWAVDLNNYYVLQIDPLTQTFSVWRLQNSRWLTPVSWRSSVAIKKGLNQVNELRVDVKGGVATVYINGQQVVTFNGVPPQGGSLVGLHVEAPANGVAKWQFKEFRVLQPS